MSLSIFSNTSVEKPFLNGRLENLYVDGNIITNHVSIPSSSTNHLKVFTGTTEIASSSYTTDVAYSINGNVVSLTCRVQINDATVFTTGQLSIQGDAIPHRIDSADLGLSSYSPFSVVSVGTNPLVMTVSNAGDNTNAEYSYLIVYAENVLSVDNKSLTQYNFYLSGHAVGGASSLILTDQPANTSASRNQSGTCRLYFTINYITDYLLNSEVQPTV